MSLLTTLAYAITAAVRPRVRDAEVAALKAQVNDLRRERDGWQSLALSYRREVIERRNPQPVQQEINRAAQALQDLSAMLGTQNFGQQLEDYVRNCTPGRHELLTRG